MDTYYVSKNAQPNGDHEVHKGSCTYLPHPINFMFLGNFATTIEAVRAAKKYYDQTNGCMHCNTGHHST